METKNEKMMFERCVQEAKNRAELAGQSFTITQEAIIRIALNELATAMTEEHRQYIIKITNMLTGG